MTDPLLPLLDAPPGPCRVDGALPEKPNGVTLAPDGLVFTVPVAAGDRVLARWQTKCIEAHNGHSPGRVPNSCLRCQNGLHDRHCPECDECGGSGRVWRSEPRTIEDVFDPINGPFVTFEEEPA